jgi:AcrR family transcriptional regulator
MIDSGESNKGGRVEARPGKRERLVSSAMDLLHQQGVEKTTLADIARRADVPLGNIYYYFKTKDEIVDAVVEAHVHGIEETIASVERVHRTPKGRLKALLGMLADQRELLAQYGCPHGTLCSELEKGASGADHGATRLIQIPIDWFEKQFQSMGCQDAHDLAVELLATYEGAAVLTHALREPELMAHESRRLKRWIDSLGG